ncbi:hypothetical protein E4T44_08639 [Aureobasidium sp. EXF-8845]|nr:hypothetical protein E4T44_08639 [Aureobasidium sp. EXF-8845]KAI4843528.1 hypothetical protein E4T45_08573 [Aureobasidium sp. EXF-8846]
MSPPETKRRPFEELHPRDRNVKTNRKTRIETNWGCDVQECVPMKIRPRVELKKGAKIRVGDIAGSEEIWWNWSVELLRGLEELSTMMAGKLNVAQELMIHEVQKRQTDGKNPQRRVAELLLGDMQRLVDNVKRHQSLAAAQGQTQQDTDMETFQELDREPGPSVMEQEGQAQVGSPECSEERFSPNDMLSQAPEAAYIHESAQEVNNTPTMKAPNFSSTPTRPPAVQMPQSTQKLNESLQLDALEMRARAKRLRGQAMRLEAEALDLESEAAMARRALDS